jgi:bla regulator protein BlaR1
MHSLSSLELAVADHLWQSTLFAVAVWLIALAMKWKRAEVRHGLWVAASAKFLIPFSLLVGIGSPFSVLQHSVPEQAPAAYSAVSSVAQPFSEIAAASVGEREHERTLGADLLGWWPVAPALVWLGGMATVLFVWHVRLRKIVALMSRAELLEEGREAEMLRRLARELRVRWRPRLMRSRGAMEPGIFGIFRPVLIWPEGLSDRLDDGPLEAVLAHETMHVLRHDNLTAALHMAVEAVFWFHPLVWWMGRRMVEERERACDEAVVRLGNGPAIYAEGLLKACRFSVESSLACVAGVTGSDLNKRIRSIMKPRIEELSMAGKLALALLGSVAVTGPVAYGIVHRVPVYGQLLITSGPRPSFAVATIKPAKPDELKLGGMSYGSITQQHVSLYDLLVSAYNMRQEGPLLGGPAWMNTKFFDIQAKWEDAQIEASKSLDVKQMVKHNQLMLQSLLAERFQLKVHTVTQEREVYALVVAKGGPKFKEVEPAASLGASEADAGVVSPPPPPPPPAPSGKEISAPDKVICMGICYTASHQITAKDAPMGMLVGWISSLHETDRMVVDETGLHGKYSFVLNEVSDRPGPLQDSGDPDAPLSLFTALPEQLGLRLKLKKVPVQVLVIDRAELPSAN